MVAAAPLIVAVGLALAAVTQSDDAPVGIVTLWAVALLVTGTGIGVAWPHLSAWAMDRVDDPSEGGAAAAAINTVQLISGAFGAGLAGVVVSANVVAATFYNFNPQLVASAIPAAWGLASPATVTRVRYEIVATALPRVLGAELSKSSELARAAVQLRRVAESIPNADGRPLYAGHAELPWPDTPIVALWHAITLLREYRGDGHIAALVTNGLSGLEALITHTATGIGFNADFARGSRRWSRDEWSAATEGLMSRGILDGEGELTPAGTELRSRIEDLTDELGYPPWRALPEDQADELVSVATVIREAVQAAGVFPAGVFPAGLFGPRHGEHR